MLEKKSFSFDLDAIIPISIIRAHTKTNEILTVTDEQLILYRDSGFEAAQRYTGLWLKGIKWVTEEVKINYRKARYQTITHKIKYVPIDGIVYFNGSAFNKSVEYSGESRIITLTSLPSEIVLGSCCDPCHSGKNINTVSYHTGVKCMADIPSGIIVGILKYISFNVRNSGDIGYTYLNNDRPVSGARLASNDPVIASGAMGEWSRYAIL